MAIPGPLDTIMRRAGAVVNESNGATVAAHYGSPAGEVAVCVRMVGLADRSDVGKLVVTGRPVSVAGLIRRLIGESLAPAGVSFTAAGYWCAASAERVIVICESARRAHLLDVLRAEARRLPGVDVTDRSAELSAIALLGRHTMSVLAALGALGPGGDPRSAPPFGRASVGGADVHVLLQSDRRALILTEPEDADRVWRAAEEAGQPFGLSPVGSEAVQRFTLLDRTVGRAPA